MAQLRRTSRWSPRAQKIGRMTLLVTLMLAVAWLANRAVMAVFTPVNSRQKVVTDYRTLAHAVAAKAAEKQALQEKIAYLRSPLGTEEAARKHGMNRPNEERINFLTPKTPVGAQTPVAVATRAHARWPLVTLALLVPLGLLAAAFIQRNRAVRARRREAAQLTPRLQLRNRHAVRPATRTRDSRQLS